MNIGLLYIKKRGGYPFTGGGFQAMTFRKYDVNFIAKIINELDMTDDSYRYALTVVTTYCNEDMPKDKMKAYDERVHLIKDLNKKLSKLNLNKDLNFDGTYINLFHKGDLL
jgi:hypothetical protein